MKLMSKSNTRARSRFRISLCLAGILCGILLAFYPMLAGMYYQRQCTAQINQATSQSEAFDESQKEQFYELAERYNQAIGTSSLHALSEEEEELYHQAASALPLNMLGTIHISKINVNLPVYFGCEEGTLQKGAGHMPGSGIPTQSGTHAVISGHTGMTTSRLFTNLDRLETGDTFTLTILGQTQSYEIIEIQTVLPSQTGQIQVLPEKELVTLVTCTPYGINSHRLLVTGQRTGDENTETDSLGLTGFGPSVLDLLGARFAYTLPGLMLAGGILLLTWILYRKQNRNE